VGGYNWIHLAQDISESL